MPGVAFLKFATGITGESKEVDGAIEVESYSFGASNPANIGSGGMSGGTASCSDFTFTCEVDTSSGQMLNQLFTGKPVSTATFTLVESTGADKSAQPPYITVTFTNCYITGQSFGGGNQGKPSQSISFAYEQIQYAYSSQKSADGTVSNSANAGFNVAQGKTV